jgi:hypothetical protein
MYLKGAYDQLQCLVFIPTSVQTLLSGLYDSFEIFQSFQPRSNLTKKRSLETMVEYLVSNFFVSDSLKGKLLSLYTFLIEEPNLSVSVNDRIRKSLVESAHNCHRYRTENKSIAHLLLGYKKVKKEQTI